MCEFVVCACQAKILARTCKCAPRSNKIWRGGSRAHSQPPKAPLLHDPECTCACACGQVSVTASVTASVGPSVRHCVRPSLRPSVCRSVHHCVHRSVGPSVTASVGPSVRASVRALRQSSRLRRSEWRLIQSPSTKKGKKLTCTHKLGSYTYVARIPINILA